MSTPHQQHQSYALIGLTGNIGSGKSTVAGIIARTHPVLSSDAIAREITATDSAVREKITAAFGPGVWREDGELDRSGVAATAFSDPSALKRLNAIIHPAVLKEMEKRARDLADTGAAMIFVESALIFEANISDRFDVVIAVLCEPEVAMRRVMDSRGLSEQEVRLRMNNQMENKVKAGLSDFVIYNNGSREALETRVQFILSTIERVCNIPL